jgi:hypothetical protein
MTNGEENCLERIGLNPEVSRECLVSPNRLEFWWLFWWLLVADSRATPCDSVQVGDVLYLFIVGDLYEKMRLHAMPCKMAKNGLKIRRP